MVTLVCCCLGVVGGEEESGLVLATGCWLAVLGETVAWGLGDFFSVIS